MIKVYYLKTCDTCKRIIKTLDLPEDTVFQDIKTEELTIKQLDELHRLSGTYEALFSRRAKLYQAMDLKNQVLSELDIKKYLLSHYTFLKRPVIIVDDALFIGNSKKNIEALQSKIEAR